MRKRLDMVRVAFFELFLLPLLFPILIVLITLSEWLPFIKTVMYYGTVPAALALFLVPFFALGVFIHLSQGDRVFEKSITVWGREIYRKRFMVTHLEGERYSEVSPDGGGMRQYRLQDVNEAGEKVILVNGFTCYMFAIGPQSLKVSEQDADMRKWLERGG